MNGEGGPGAARSSQEEEPAGSGVSLGRLFLTFGRVGATSFGGGATTLALIRREAVERHGWITGEEFILYFGMGQLVPGINLLALTVLIGHRMRGALGILVCLLGLTLPAFALTLAFCAILRAPALHRWSSAAMRGALPVVIALLLDTAYRLARESMPARWRRRTLFDVGLVLIALLASVAVHLHPALIVLLAAAVYAGISHLWQGRKA